MKIILLILLSTCLCIANSEYPRFKRRGPQQNGPPRSPAPPPYGKKWGKPPQKMPQQFMQTRPYPGPPQQMRGGRPKPPMHLSHGVNIPLNNAGHLQHPMMAGPKFPQFPYYPKPQSIPKKAYFKNPLQQHKISNVKGISGAMIQFPQESNHIPQIVHKQEKPSFVSSPSISALEYDYHIQSNSIPTNVNPIKQVGEKGPIHTIPAPNLTPADKPNNLEFVNKEPHYHPQQEFRVQQPQYEQQTSHHYQVTEPSEQPPKQVFRDQINMQTHYNQNAGAQSYQTLPPNQQFDQQSNLQFEQQTSHQFDQLLNQQLQQQNVAQNYQTLQSPIYHPEHPGLTLQNDGNHGINIGFGQLQDELAGQEDMMFSNSKHYQVINDDQFSTGAPNQNGQTQAIQSSFAQQQPQLLSKFLEEPGYIQQYQPENLQIASDMSVNPEYHSFNYDEQAHQAAQAKSGQAGFVTAAYSLGGSDEIIKGENIHSRSSSIDPITQAQIVQNYFDTRSQNTVEPDAKPSVPEVSDKENLKNQYYSSLPNKEAADRLANLQAAGKVNSNLMIQGNNKRNQHENANEMPTIYVPDENNSSDKKEDRMDQDGDEQSLEYEDYSQEEEASQSEEKSGFGHKLKARK